MAEATTMRLKTSGMHCPSCSMLIELNVSDLPGVESVRADYKTGVTEVVFDPGAVTSEEIVAEIEKAGYSAEPE